ncbi:MAG: hypothetical protein OEV60_06390 [Actinomycetota bacterium]|nr:hypothetical protein [Actinomycetota bacterium]MDH5223325.1 hypothetical protein [Actinomycetota bacterium]MDH5313070.1 hypothetical protein [Actinomycetota bacterium]
MSQVETTTPTTSSRTRRERVETFLKGFEWSWTTAVVFSVGLVFFLLITTSVLPSFWMYVSEQKLGWQGPTDIEAALQEIPTLLPGGDPAAYDELLLQVRDAIAMGLSTVPIIIVLVGASIMQNWRHKLRGRSESRPTGGYR